MIIIGLLVMCVAFPIVALMLFLGIGKAVLTFLGVSMALGFLLNLFK